MSVERIDLIFNRIVKAPHGKIFATKALELVSYRHLLKFPLTINYSFFDIPDEMIMGLRIRMDEVDEYLSVTDKATSNEGIREIFDRHGIIVNIKSVVDIKLILLNLL